MTLPASARHSQFLLKGVCSLTYGDILMQNIMIMWKRPPYILCHTPFVENATLRYRVCLSLYKTLYFMRGVDLHLSLRDGTYLVIHTRLRFASSANSLAAAQLVSCIVAVCTTLVPRSVFFRYPSYFLQQNNTDSWCSVLAILREVCKQGYVCTLVA